MPATSEPMSGGCRELSRRLIWIYQIRSERPTRRRTAVRSRPGVWIRRVKLAYFPVSVSHPLLALAQSALPIGFKGRAVHSHVAFGPSHSFLELTSLPCTMPTQLFNIFSPLLWRSEVARCLTFPRIPEELLRGNLNSPWCSILDSGRVNDELAVLNSERQRTLTSTYP